MQQKYMAVDRREGLALLEYLYPYLESPSSIGISGTCVLIKAMCINEKTVRAINTYAAALSHARYKGSRVWSTDVNVLYNAARLEVEVSNDNFRFNAEGNSRVSFAFINCVFESIEDDAYPWIYSFNRVFTIGSLNFINCVINKLQIGYTEGVLQYDTVSLNCTNTVGTVHLKNILQVSRRYSGSNNITLKDSKISIIQDNSNVIGNTMKYRFNQLEKQGMTVGEMSTFMFARGVKAASRDVRKLRSRLRSAESTGYQLMSEAWRRAREEHKATGTHAQIDYSAVERASRAATEYETERALREINSTSLSQGHKPSMCNLFIRDTTPTEVDKLSKYINNIFSEVIVGGIYHYNSSLSDIAGLVTVTDVDTVFKLQNGTLEVLNQGDYYKFEREITQQELKAIRKMEATLAEKGKAPIHGAKHMYSSSTVYHDSIDADILRNISQLRDASKVLLVSSGKGLSSGGGNEAEYVQMVAKYSEDVAYFDTIMYSSDRFKKEIFQYLKNEG